MGDGVCYRILQKSTKSGETFVLGAKYERSSRRGGQNRETVPVYGIPLVYSGHEGKGFWYGLYGQTELRWFPVQPVVYGRRVYVSTAYITSMDSGKRGIVRLSSHAGPRLTFRPVTPPQFVIIWFINCRFPTCTSNYSFSSLKHKPFSLLWYFLRGRKNERVFSSHILGSSEIKNRKRKWKFWSFWLCRNSKIKCRDIFQSYNFVSRIHLIRD